MHPLLLSCSYYQLALLHKQLDKIHPGLILLLYHRQFLQKVSHYGYHEEMKQIRLEEQALAARPATPGWYGRRMFSLGNWMISTGRQLRGRYEQESHPASPTQKIRGSYAR